MRLCSELKVNILKLRSLLNKQTEIIVDYGLGCAEYLGSSFVLGLIVQIKFKIFVFLPEGGKF